MSVRPVWAIFGFVTSSILVAGVYHSMTLGQKDRPLTPASWQVSMPGWSHIWGNTSAPVCTDSAGLKMWSDFPPIFRSARYRHGGDFQIQCLKSSAHSLPSVNRGLACAAAATPEAQCAKEEEILVTYNVMLDLTDCFEIAQREFLPLIASQSGPRMGYLSVDQKDEPGVLRPADWTQFQNRWPEVLAQLKSGEKSSCRRLGALFEKTNIPEAPKLCDSVTQPQESLIVMVAVAERFARVSAEITDAWDPAMIDPYLAELDTRIEDRMILRYWTHLLAYFENSNKAIDIAKAFVETRSGDDERIRPGELSWSNLTTGERRPASLDEDPVSSVQWPGHLNERLDPVASTKILRVARWLNWVREQELSGACASELWTLEISPTSGQ